MTDVVEAVVAFTVMLAVVRAVAWLRIHGADARERGAHSAARTIFLGAALLVFAPIMHARAAEVATSPADDPFDVAHHDTVYADSDAGRAKLDADVLASDAHDDSGFSPGGTFARRAGNGAADPDAVPTAQAQAAAVDATTNCNC